jgi:hypothetical protein
MRRSLQAATGRARNWHSIALSRTRREASMVAKTVNCSPGSWPPTNFLACREAAV